MKQHISNVAVLGFCHLRRLRQICRRISNEAATHLVLTLIMSRLDYCNSVLAGLPEMMVAPMQRVAPLQCMQNAAACLGYT